MKLLAPSIGFVLLLCGLNFLYANEAWTSFQNAGIANIKEGKLPAKWSPDTNVLWQKKLAGYGQSSPVTDGKHIYVTSTSGEMKENLHVEAFDLEGKQVWQFQGKNSSPFKNSTYVSRAAPTPVLDQAGIIAFFEGGNIFALTVEGKKRWEKDLVAEYGKIESRHGLGASIEQDSDQIYVWVERSADPYILALSKKTGDVVWKSKGLGVTSWSSPRIVSVDDSTKHLVLSGIGKIAGLNPKTGEHLWEFDDISGNSTTTPFPMKSGKFLIGASASRTPGAGGNAAKSNGMIEIKKDESGKFTAGWVWQSERATSSFGSPIAHAGFAYFVNRSGVIYCLDSKTGEEKYVMRTPSSIWATPLANAGLVFFFGKNGVTTVIAAGEEEKTIAENVLWKSEPAEEPKPAGGPSFGGPVLYAAVSVQSNLILRRGDIIYFVSKQ
jgi:outer membrane protein assembly factor BamB